MSVEYLAVVVETNISKMNEIMLHILVASHIWKNEGQYGNQLAVE